MPNNEVVESEERSGSDTDSQSTPTQSPAHRPGEYSFFPWNFLVLPLHFPLRVGGPSRQTETNNVSPLPLRAAKPPQRPSSVLKPSGSSFGLHSPDNLPLTLQNREDDIKALIKQLEDNSGLPYTFAEGTLYLDPDIIDLTMIPPPITPDEVRPQAYVSRCIRGFRLFAPYVLKMLIHIKKVYEILCKSVTFYIQYHSCKY